MSATAAWLAANQRHLMAAVDALHAALERALGRPSKSGGDRDENAAAEALRAAEEALPAPSALGRIEAAFHLSPFERDVLLLCAGVELSTAFADLCAGALRQGPTWSLALAVLPGAHWSAFAPSAPLRRYHLVEVLAGERLTQSPLRIDERVLHHLTGIAYLDVRLQGFLEPHATGADALSGPQSEAADQLVRLWGSATTGRPPCPRP